MGLRRLPRFLCAAVSLCAALILCVPAAGAQELSPELERALAERPLVSSFTLKPDRLALLPNYPGSDAFQARHGALAPHAVQEAIFALPPNSLRIDRDVVYRILSEAPSLTDLTYRPNGKKPVRLFHGVRFLEPPTRADMRCVVEVHDADFGTIRFAATAEALDNRIELRMVNLDPLRFLRFPAVPPKQALVDLVYYVGPDRSLVYTAWSVRAYIFLPSAVDVKTPLYRRTVALKEWFVDLLERFEQ